MPLLEGLQRLLPAMFCLALTRAREEELEDTGAVHDSPEGHDYYANDEKLPCDYCKDWSITRRKEPDLKPGEWLQKYGVSVGPAAHSRTW